jgi:hypothetical protein
VNSPTWLDDNTVLYGINDQLWKYDLPSGSASVIAKLGDTGQVSQIAPSKDGAYVYISVQKTNTSDGLGFELVRLGLRNQPISPALQKIRLLIPNLVNGCALGYTNFTHPTITTQGSSSSRDLCIQNAKDYLQPYGVDLSLFQFVFLASN